MSDSVAYQSSKHGCQPVGAVVYLETERLFGGRVPHGHEEDEAWVDGSFEGAQEKAVGCYTGEGSACWSRDEDDAPCDGRNREEFADGEALHEVSGGELEEEVSEVED